MSIDDVALRVRNGKSFAQIILKLEMERYCFGKPRLTPKERMMLWKLYKA